MAYRDSNQPIILYEIEEGADRILSLQRITFARLSDWITNANLSAGNSKEGKTNLSFTEASISVEPSAVVPHVGSVRGQSGNWLSYRDNL